MISVFELKNFLMLDWIIFEIFVSTSCSYSSELIIKWTVGTHKLTFYSYLFYMKSPIFENPLTQKNAQFKNPYGYFLSDNFDNEVGKLVDTLKYCYHRSYSHFSNEKPESGSQKWKVFLSMLYVVDTESPRRLWCKHFGIVQDILTSKRLLNVSICLTI